MAPAVVGVAAKVDMVRLKVVVVVAVVNLLKKEFRQCNDIIFFLGCGIYDDRRDENTTIAAAVPFSSRTYVHFRAITNMQKDTASIIFSCQRSGVMFLVSAKNDRDGVILWSRLVRRR